MPAVSFEVGYWPVAGGVAGAGAAGGVVVVVVSVAGGVVVVVVPVSAGGVVVVVVPVSAGGVVVVVVPVSAGGVVVVVEELDELELSGVAGAVVVGCSTVTLVVSLLRIPKYQMAAMAASAMIAPRIHPVADEESGLGFL